MIDVNSEQLLTFKQAARHPVFLNKHGKTGHVAKVYRAGTVGARAVDGRRVRLEYIKGPGGFMTSTEAIARLVESLTNPGPIASDMPTATPNAQRREAARVDRELDRAGIV